MIPGVLLPYKIRELILKKQFRERMGRRLDLRSPKSFNEKIQWYKLYYYNPDSFRFIDKLGFKSYVSERIGCGHTAELYGVWDDAGKVDLSDIPLPCVLKSNCSSYGNNLMFILGRDKYDPIRLRPELDRWLDPMNTDLALLGREFYSIRKPLIIAEAFLGKGDIAPTDYKFYCFDGKPYCVYSAYGHFDRGKPVPSAISFYDMNWEPLDVRYGGAKRMDLPKPEHFEEMKRAAEILSEGFPFIRVDFYDCEDTYYLGEMTLTPGDGFKSFEPDSFDYELGELFRLPKRNTKKEDFREDVYKAYTAYIKRSFIGRSQHKRKRNNRHS